MALNPLDIRRTEFTRRLRGLDADEVSAYLELLAREFEGMQHETQAAQDRIRELENRIQHYERIELALEEALRTTRESSRQAVESAHQKADQIRAEASREAERVTHQAEQEHTRLRQEAQAIAVRRKEIVARLRAFLMSEMEVLAHFDGEDPVGFIKLMPQSEAFLGGRGHDPALPTQHEAASAPAEAPASEPAPVPTASEPSFEDTAPADTANWGAVTPAADYPTPPPEPMVGAVDLDFAPSAPWADATAGYAPEIEAYFQNLTTPPEGALPAAAAADEETWDTPAPETSDSAQEAAASVVPDAHAPEPGESPVPEAFYPVDTPAAQVADAPQDFAAETVTPDYERYDLHADSAGRDLSGLASENGDLAEPVPATDANAFVTRAAPRERFRIETLVGAPPAPARPDADLSEESQHIRRLLDSLD